MGQAFWPKSSRKGIGVYTPTVMDHDVGVQLKERRVAVAQRRADCEQTGRGQERKGAAPPRGCSCKVASPAAAWRRTCGIGEAAADVSGPVEGACAKGNSSSGGARKGAAPRPVRSSSGRLERRSDGREEIATGKERWDYDGERKMGSFFLQNGSRACGRLIVKLPHLSP